MIDNDERKIVEEEIARLERLWQDAQERYGYTGSRSTNRTMTKYRVIMNALELVLNDERYARLEEDRNQMFNRLMAAKHLVQRMAQAGRIPADVANVVVMELGR